MAGAQPRAVSTPWAALISPSRAIVQTSPGVVSNLRVLRPHRLAPPSHETATPRRCCPQRSPQLFNMTKHGTGEAATQLCEAQQFQTHRTPKTKDIINVYEQFFLILGTGAPLLTPANRVWVPSTQSCRWNLSHPRFMNPNNCIGACCQCSWTGDANNYQSPPEGCTSN